MSRTTLFYANLVLWPLAAVAAGAAIYQTAAREETKPNLPSRVTPIADTPKPNLPPPEPEQPVASLRDIELWSDCYANAIAADARYKGKRVTVTGTVRCIEVAADGRSFVGLDTLQFEVGSPAAYHRLTPTEKRWFNEGCPPNVVCYVASDAAARFAAMQKGQPVSIIGRVRGATKEPNTFRDLVVTLEDCRPSH